MAISVDQFKSKFTTLSDAAKEKVKGAFGQLTDAQKKSFVSGSGADAPTKEPKATPPNTPPNTPPPPTTLPQPNIPVQEPTPPPTPTGSSSLPQPKPTVNSLAEGLTARVNADKAAGMTPAEIKEKYSSQYQSLVNQRAEDQASAREQSQDMQVARDDQGGLTTYATKDGVSDPENFNKIPTMFDSAITRKFTDQKQADEYMDRRNNRVATEFVARMNEALASGVKMDDATRDRILEETVSEMDPENGKIQWGDPFWNNTVDNIYEKTLQQTGVQSWDDLYVSGMNTSAQQNAISSMSDDKLAVGLTGGEFSMTDLQFIKDTDPARYAQIVSLSQEYQTANEYNNVIGGYEENEITRMGYVAPKFDDSLKEAGISKSFVTDLFGSGTEDLEAKRTQLMETPETKKLIPEVNTLSEEMQTLNEEKFNLMDDLRGQYPDLSDQDLKGIYYDRLEGIDKRTRTVGIELQAKQSLLSSYQSQAEKKFNVYAQQSKNQTEAKRRERGVRYGMAKDDFAREWNTYEKNVDQADKQYWKEKDMEEKIMMMGIDQEYKKDYATFMKSLDDNYGGNIFSYKDKDGNQVFVDKATMQTVGNFDPKGGVAKGANYDSFWNTSTITNLGGRNGNISDKGVDFDGANGEAIPAPYSGIVERVRTTSDGNVQLNFRTDDGYLIQTNHNNPKTLETFKKGQRIEAGEPFSIVGTTGKVIPMNGGDGSHLDIWVVDPKGNNIVKQDAVNFLRSGGTKAPVDDQGVSSAYSQPPPYQAPTGGSPQTAIDIATSPESQAIFDDIRSGRETVYKLLKKYTPADKISFINKTSAGYVLDSLLKNNGELTTSGLVDSFKALNTTFKKDFDDSTKWSVVPSLVDVYGSQETAGVIIDKSSPFVPKANPGEVKLNLPSVIASAMDQGVTLSKDERISVIQRSGIGGTEQGGVRGTPFLKDRDARLIYKEALKKI